jgi:hypothetical protein
MGSTLPTRASIPQLLLDTGWTYQELMEQPADVVESMIELMSATARVQRQMRKR